MSIWRSACCPCSSPPDGSFEASAQPTGRTLCAACSACGTFGISIPAHRPRWSWGPHETQPWPAARGGETLSGLETPSIFYTQREIERHACARSPSWRSGCAWARSQHCGWEAWWCCCAGRCPVPCWPRTSAAATRWPWSASWSSSPLGPPPCGWPCPWPLPWSSGWPGSAAHSCWSISSPWCSTSVRTRGLARTPAWQRYLEMERHAERLQCGGNAYCAGARRAWVTLHPWHACAPRP
jgi:hypothetical protein